MTRNAVRCSNCGSTECKPFYRVQQAPVHCVALINDLESALAYPVGTIDLIYCEACGFVFNAAFDAELQDYQHDYESTQAYSKTFNAFHASLADQLIDRYKLHGRRLVEIGCGQGEFLELLCERGGNTGLGFDPAFETDRGVKRPDVRVVKDYFSKAHGPLEADFICCKMTMEHIPQTRRFMKMVRNAIPGGETCHSSRLQHRNGP